MARIKCFAGLAGQVKWAKESQASVPNREVLFSVLGGGAGEARGARELEAGRAAEECTEGVGRVERSLVGVRAVAGPEARGGGVATGGGASGRAGAFGLLQALRRKCWLLERKCAVLAGGVKRVTEVDGELEEVEREVARLERLERDAEPQVISIEADDEVEGVYSEGESQVVASQSSLRKPKRQLRTRPLEVNYKLPELEDDFDYHMGAVGKDKDGIEDVTMEAESEDSQYLSTMEEIDDEIRDSDREFVADGLEKYLGEEPSQDYEYQEEEPDASFQRVQSSQDLEPKRPASTDIQEIVLDSSPEKTCAQDVIPEINLLDQLDDEEIFEERIVGSMSQCALPLGNSLPQDSNWASLSDSDIEAFDQERENKIQVNNIKELDDDLKIISENSVSASMDGVIMSNTGEGLPTPEQDVGHPIHGDDIDDDHDFSIGEINQLCRSKMDTYSSVAYDRQTEQASHPWIPEVYHKLNNIFKLPGFRPNQLEAVNATLSCKDVFVLMPTGGGKSLCYQLPAIVKSGMTSGTTIVVSPLISLMQDQVEHLLAKGIKASMFSSKGTAEQRRLTFNLFINGLLDLVYISPEMISSSVQCRNAIKKLYQNHMLARIVVDEAHCVSNWGHDFRPDYKELKIFKHEYPDIPMMALTATASEQVRMDVVHNLQLKDPVFLKQSFNRTNLYYEVLKKDKGSMSDICKAIKTTFKGQTGIIYCHSKNSCEQTASLIEQSGVKCAYYHAGMDPDDRLRVQQSWQYGRVQVICATVAFGMGIDKADVRFVYHFTVPRTLEGYYQETGRAGRDGKPSRCIMYYSFRDIRSIQSMIQKDKNLDRDNKEKHLTKLQQVMQYCENTTECRRQLVLSYFNEKFSAKDCNKNCDNCMNGENQEYEDKDFTAEALEITKLVQSVKDDKVTLIHCQDIYKGSKNAKVIQMCHDQSEFHGLGKKMTKSDIERLFFHLITLQVLQEYSVMNGRGFASDYVKLGPKANALLRGRMKISIQCAIMNSRPPSATAHSNASALASKQDSTNYNTANPKPNLSNYVYQPGNSKSNNIKEHNPQTVKHHVEYAYSKLFSMAKKLKADSFNGGTVEIPPQVLRQLATHLPTTIQAFQRFFPGGQFGTTFKYLSHSLTALKQERNAIASRTQPVHQHPKNPALADTGPQSHYFTSDNEQQSQDLAIVSQIREALEPSKPKDSSVGKKHSVQKPPRRRTKFKKYTKGSNKYQ